MDIKRRTLLKGVAATAAVGISAPHFAFATPLENALIKLRESDSTQINRKPITAVLVESAKNSAFAEGLAAASPSDTVILNGVDFNNLTRLLSQKSHNLVGVIDHANAAVLVQLSRHYDAKIHWLGQHSLQTDNCSHNILRSASTESCQNQLAKDLSVDNGTHVLREQGLEQHRISGEASAGHPQAWAANLALALGDIHNPEPAYHALDLSPQVATINGSAITFLIETC